MMTEDSSDMMMIMVVPTHIFLGRKESSLWLLFPFSYYKVHQSYLQFLKSIPK